jgi:hypothetical protein
LDNNLSIHIISGLPRSGTSMVMRMLQNGGMPLVVDGVRQADSDNPRGYFEYEPVKHLQKDRAWLGQCRGKALKVVSNLLPYLPGEYDYKVIFMLRPISQVLASQKKMLLGQGLAYDRGQEPRLAAKFKDHLYDIRLWLAKTANFNTLFLKYPQVVANPSGHAALIRDFLGLELDISAMSAAVEPSLHHNQG